MTTGASDGVIAAAEAALQAGEIDRATRLLRRALLADADNPAAWRALAQCYTGARRAMCLRWAEACANQPETGTPPAITRRSKHGQTVSRMSATASLALLGVLGGWTTIDLRYRDRILPGVMIHGVDVSGLPRQAVRQRLLSAKEERGERVVLLRAAGGEWGVRAGHLLPAWSDGALRAADLFGHEPLLADRMRSRWAAFAGAAPVFGSVDVAPEAVRQVVRQLRAAIERPARDAELKRAESGWRITPEQSGRSLDTAAAEALIVTTLQQAMGAPSTREPLKIDLPIITTAPRITAQDLRPLGARLEALRTSSLLVAVGERTWTVDRSAFVLLDPASEGKPTLVPDMPALQRQLAQWSAAVDQPAQPSQLVRSGDRVTDLLPGRPGQIIDRPAAAQTLASVLMDDVSTVNLPLQTVAPPPGEVERLGLLSEIGRGESQFEIYASPGRDSNVQAGGHDIDGVLVPPGDIFSFTATVGSITWDKGYRWGEMIEAGQIRPSVGGGICQVSTTVFRAAFWSGLEIVERHAHSWRLPWYELGAPPGMDATIALGGPDLKIRNNTAAHILIRVQTDLIKKRQTVIIYGTPTNRRVEMAHAGSGSRWNVERTVLAGDTVLAQDRFTSSYSR